MKYCMRCGVQINEEKNRVCPLCNTIILKDEEIDKLSLEQIKIDNVVKKLKKKKNVNKEKKNKIGMTSIIMLLSSLISILILLIIDIAIGFNIDWSIIPIISIILFVLIVNLPLLKIKKHIYWFFTYDTFILCMYFLLLNYIISENISWSYYVGLSLMLLWVYISSIYFNKIKGFIYKFLVDFIGTSIFVLLVSLGLDHNSGFSNIAVPINGLVFILTIISYLFIKTYIYNWRIIITTLSINTSILCIGIDLIIQKYINGQFYLNWSYIVLIVLIPFTLLMYYLDNSYKIHKYLIKKFHI